MKKLYAFFAAALMSVSMYVSYSVSSSLMTLKSATTFVSLELLTTGVRATAQQRLGATARSLIQFLVLMVGMQLSCRTAKVSRANRLKNRAMVALLGTISAVTRTLGYM